MDTNPEQKGWIGVDLDGTLAKYDHFRDPLHIGEPIVQMVNRVQRWRANGIVVKIVTARVNAGTFVDKNGDPKVVTPEDVASVTKVIQDWTEEHIGERLPVTCSKDLNMFQLWDDRCVQVIRNKGGPASLIRFIEKHDLDTDLIQRKRLVDVYVDNKKVLHKVHEDDRYGTIGNYLAERLISPDRVTYHIRGWER